jgi:hypothetical protein
VAKNSRRIGAVFERECAKLLSKLWYSSAYRTAQRTGLGGTADVTDALPSGHVECKKRQTMAVYNFLDQADRDRPDEHYSVLLLRANHRPPLFCLRVDDTERFISDFLTNYKSAGARSEAIEQAWLTPQSSGGE